MMQGQWRGVLKIEEDLTLTLCESSGAGGLSYVSVHKCLQYGEKQKEFEVCAELENYGVIRNRIAVTWNVYFSYYFLSNF